MSTVFALKKLKNYGKGGYYDIDKTKNGSKCKIS